MTTLAQRDDAQLRRGFTAWCAHQWPTAGFAVERLARPSAGWSNETLLVTLQGAGADARREQLVVRLPPPIPTWPHYDLAAQARLLDALAATAVPVPDLVAFEPDAQWLGAEFLVMAHAPGRPGGEVPAFDPWIADAPPADQRRLHESYLAMLATIHQVDWRSAALDSVLRGGDGALAAEVGWWRDYVDWAADGAPTPVLADAAAWCAANLPAGEPAASLCWGDPRVGNMLFADDRRVSAVLDWELATIGPAESDLAWYLALDELTTRFTKRSVAGFLTRDEIVDHAERKLGRGLVALEWHEIFALVRSTAINDRQARLAAAAGVAYPGVAGADNPVLGHLARRVERYSGA